MPVEIEFKGTGTLVTGTGETTAIGSDGLDTEVEVVWAVAGCCAAMAAAADRTTSEDVPSRRPAKDFLISMLRLLITCGIATFPVTFILERKKHGNVGAQGHFAPRV
jgi:hypothetical protein